MTGLPLYKEVKNKIIQSLIGGEWRPGEMMPSEPKLAGRYRVGINTIRAAVGELVAANVLVRQQGKGTFVSLYAGGQNLYRFFSIVRADGERELPARETRSLRLAKADAKTADMLRLPRRGNGARVFRLKIVISFGGTAVGVSDITIPAGLFKGLARRGFEDGSVSLYGLYQANYGVSIIRVVDMLGAARARARVAKALGVRVGEPVLEVQRVAYTFNDRPVEVRRTHFRTRDYRYLVDQGGTG